MPKTAIIVGAGLAGSLLACYLSDLGYAVHVYERRPDPRAKGFVGGRSINLALSVRGLAGLRGAHLDQLVLSTEAIRMPGRMIHAADASLTYQPYSSNPDDAINSVSRSGLNLALIHAAAQRPRVTFTFSSPCIDADLASPAAIFESPTGSVRREADLLIAADGAFSAVRLAMMKTDRFDYSQSYLRHGYKELHIPPAHVPSAPVRPGSPVDPACFRLEPHALHIWPRGGAMMIALPNRDGSFTCTLFWPFVGDHSFANFSDETRILDFFREHYPDAVPLMPTLVHDFTTNPTSSLVTVRCAPWRVGRTILLGDAAHAIVPFYGQGMNAAFEDCAALAACLRHTPDDLIAALDEYQQRRKPSADAIADMALENFVEMRDLAGRPDFQHRKRIEQTLHRLFGDALTPQYNLVSFSTVPYELAQRRGVEMSALVQAVAQQVRPSTTPPGSSPDTARSPQAEASAFSEWDRAVRAAATPLLHAITPIPPDAGPH